MDDSSSIPVGNFVVSGPDTKYSNLIILLCPFSDTIKYNYNDLTYVMILP